VVGVESEMVKNQEVKEVHCMQETTLKIALAGVLHDVGKNSLYYSRTIS